MGDAALRPVPVPFPAAVPSTRARFLLPPRRIFRFLDRMIEGALGKVQPADRDAYFSFLMRLNHQRTEIEAVHDEIRFIDTKATGLLTHASMMIATIGILLPLIASSVLERGLLLFEMTLYMTVATLCIRCISSRVKPNARLKEAQFLRNLKNEVYLMRRLYDNLSAVTILLSVSFFIIIPIVTIWKP